MNNKDKELEQILLNNASLEDLIRKKIENEFISEAKKSKIKPKVKRISDISDAPKNLIFSQKSVFKVFNRKTKTESYINGLQAEALLGLQNSVREQMAIGATSAFATDEAYVKFEYVEYFE